MFVISISNVINKGTGRLYKRTERDMRKVGIGEGVRKKEI